MYPVIFAHLASTLARKMATSPEHDPGTVCTSKDSSHCTMWPSERLASIGLDSWQGVAQARRRDRRGIRPIVTLLGAGKRDGYDIDKMGSFGLWFGDATNSAGRSWWNGFSRFKSRRGANAVVRESSRLPSIRAGFAGYS